MRNLSLFTTKYLPIFAGLMLTACQSGVIPNANLPEPSSAAQLIQEAKVDPNEGHLVGQVQLAFKDSTDISSFVQEMAEKNSVRLSALSKIEGRNIYLFQYESKLSMNETLQVLKKEDRVLAASPNYPVQIENFDPDFPLQWALKNTGQEAPGALAGRVAADISFDPNSEVGSANVVVAVVDTGLDYTHEDLAITEEVNGSLQVVGGNIWINPGEIPGNNRNDDNNLGDGLSFVDDVFGYNFGDMHGDPMDDHGHGTHVAGVIGALRNNFKGMKGMNSQVKLMGVKFLGASGGGSLWAAQQSIYYVVDMAKRYPEKRFIMNCSWGSSGRDSQHGDADDFLLLAFKEADESNVFTAAAAGNSALGTEFSPHYPSNYSAKLGSVISVAATNNNDQLADFSNYGHRSVQVAAPGVLIYSTLPGNQYAAWSGTSMATPHVAGLAAMIWANEPELSALELKERIMNTSDILPQLNGLVTSGGRINVARALAADFNVGVGPVVEEISQVVRSPRVTGGAEHITTLKEEGATSISVCFERIDLSGSGDWLQVYGSDYRVRDIIQGVHRNKNLFTDEKMPVCSAPIPGDTIHLRLTTAGSLDLGGLVIDMGSGGSSSFVTESLRVTR